jgi:hypothetical protein
MTLWLQDTGKCVQQDSSASQKQWSIRIELEGLREAAISGYFGFKERVLFCVKEKPGTSILQILDTKVTHSTSGNIHIKGAYKNNNDDNLPMFKGLNKTTQVSNIKATTKIQNL